MDSGQASVFVECVDRSEGAGFLCLFSFVGNTPRIREGQPSTPMISCKPWRSAGLLAHLPARG